MHLRGSPSSRYLQVDPREHRGLPLELADVRVGYCRSSVCRSMKLCTSQTLKPGGMPRNRRSPTPKSMITTFPIFVSDIVGVTSSADVPLAMSASRCQQSPQSLESTYRRPGQNSAQSRCWTAADLRYGQLLSTTATITIFLDEYTSVNDSACLM